MAEETTAENQQEESRFPKALLFKVLPIIVVAILAAGGVFAVAKTRPEVLGLAKSDGQVQAEVDELVNEVGSLITLPTDETPTIATVSDVEKVKSQNFFRNAQNGDRLLIYANAKKAILYRPTENKIIEVGAVNINQQPVASPEGSPEASPESQENTDTSAPEETSTPDTP